MEFWQRTYLHHTCKNTINWCLIHYTSPLPQSGIALADVLWVGDNCMTTKEVSHLQRRLKPMEHLSQPLFWYLSHTPGPGCSKLGKDNLEISSKFEFRYVNLKRQNQFNVFDVNKLMIGCGPWREQRKSSKKHRLNLNPRFELIGLPAKEYWYIQTEILREGAALNPFRSVNLFIFSPDRVYVFAFRCKFVIRESTLGRAWRDKWQKVWRVL